MASIVVVAVDVTVHVLARQAAEQLAADVDSARREAEQARDAVAAASFFVACNLWSPHLQRTVTGALVVLLVAVPGAQLDRDQPGRLVKERPHRAPRPPGRGGASR